MPTSVVAAPPEVRGTRPMPPGHRRLHRGFVAFNTVMPVLGLGWAIAGLWGWGVTALDVALLASGHVLTTLGITVGFHRMFTHGGLRARTPVRAVFAVLGTLAMQGPVLKWCAEHRRHHAYSDRDGDPHSPHLEDGDGPMAVLRGLWFAHVGWMFAPLTTDPDVWAPDLVEDPVVRRASAAYVPLVVVSLGLPALVGGLVTGTASGAVRAFVWGGLVRVFLQLHTTWSINSICHVFGRRPYVSRDESRNVAWLSLLSLGESWHNTHHAFPSSARHGLDRRQPDPTAWVIEGMERLGLVHDVKRPPAALVARRRTAGRQPTGVSVPSSRRVK